MAISIEMADIAINQTDKKTLFSEQLWESLTKNNDARGGRLCLITGEQGCGKTTLLRRLAEIFLEHDTIVIWRGRPVEQIYWIPNWKERCVFWHWERDSFKAYDVRGSVNIPIDDIEVRSYASPRDLMKKLTRGKINVVYEPTEFYFSDEVNMFDVVRKSTGLKIAEKVKREPHESEFIWFEIMYLLISRLDTYWYAVLIDEADDIFPENPQSIRWKLQEWAKNSMRDLRKTRTSLVMCTHALGDMDHRIRSKIQFFIYMKNARIPETSTVKRKTLANALEVGEFIIENGYFGKGWVHPYARPKDMGDLRIVLERIEEGGE
jgi:energy-coupling factor transporter ATP-binding protein EcfA2